jgi:hypothetical protein
VSLEPIQAGTTENITKGILKFTRRNWNYINRINLRK